MIFDQKKVKTKKFKDVESWLKFRADYINSTEIAALFNASPYMTAFELWHIKQGGQITEFKVKDNERMTWGRRLQGTIAQGIAEDHAWGLEDLNLFYAFDKKTGLGSSFDYKITENRDGEMVPGLLEVKNVDGLAFKDGWLVDGDDIQAPPHIEFQVQQQLLLSGASFEYIGALVGGNKPVIIKREPDPKTFKAILERTREFWKSIKEGVEPKPDFKKDYEFISELYSKATKGKVLNDVENTEWLPLINQYHTVSEKIKSLELDKMAVKAELVVKVADNEKVFGKEFSINAANVKETVISFTKKAYRNFKITIKGEKDGGK